MTEVLKRQCSKSKKGYNQVRGRAPKKIKTQNIIRCTLLSLHMLSLRVSSGKHFSISEVRVDKVQVNCGDDGTTFAVCLDQDEKKFIQSVIRYCTSDKASS